MVSGIVSVGNAGSPLLTGVSGEARRVLSSAIAGATVSAIGLSVDNADAPLFMGTCGEVRRTLSSAGAIADDGRISLGLDGDTFCGWLTLLVFATGRGAALVVVAMISPKDSTVATTKKVIKVFASIFTFDHLLES